MSNLFYGWYDDPHQPVDQPTYDPPHNGPCLFCGKPISDDVRTHSMMRTEGYGRRSYFFRTHRTCDEAVSPDTRLSVDEVIWCMIERNGD